MKINLDNRIGNPELLKLAQARFRKFAFVGGNDPAMTGDPSGGMPPMDPSAMGGMPPMDPSMMGGGGAPPPPPGPSAEDINQMVQQAVQQAMSGSGMSGGSGMGGDMIKPKIDVNVELMQIKNLLAKLCDANGIQIPAEMMVATPEKLTAMAQGSAQGGITQGAGGGGGSAMGAIPPMGGMQGSGVPGGGGEKSGHLKKAYIESGEAFDTTNLSVARNSSLAIMDIIKRRKDQLRAS